MKKTPSHEAPPKARKPAHILTPEELAACYARVFLGSADGQRVLDDLRAKFSVRRLAFSPNAAGIFDPLAAALRDGERRVMLEIEDALSAALPLIPQTKPNTPK